MDRWDLGRHTPELNDACEAQPTFTKGFILGTPIATEKGWRPVQSIEAGDLVLTFDEGLKPVIETRAETHWVAADFVPHGFWPILVPTMALGNKNELLLMPDQGVLVQCELSAEFVNVPRAIIRSRDLVGFRGVQRVMPKREFEITTLVFAGEQIVYAQGGSLIHCPRDPSVYSDVPLGAQSNYPELSSQMAALVIDEIQSADARPVRLSA